MPRKRVIDQLRKMFPGEWRYDWDRLNWTNGDKTITAYSVLSPQHESDDITCRTEFQDQDGYVVYLSQSCGNYRV
jgi:hypothetical protein